MRTSLVLGCLLVAACGDGSGYAPLSMSDREALCADLCARQVECSPGAVCNQSCVENLGVYRGDLTSEIYGCVLDLSCEASQQTCYDDALANATPSPTYEDFVAACEAFAADCGFVPDLVDGQCDSPNHMIFADDVLVDLIACVMTQDCEAAQSCVRERLPF